MQRDDRKVIVPDAWLMAELLAHTSREIRRLRVTRGRSRKSLEQLRRAAAILTVAAGFATLADPTLADPVYGTPSTNPFGLTTVSGGEGSPVFVDIDDDNDLDFFIGKSMTGNIHYFENTGTAMSPAFGTPVSNPFGIVAVGSLPAPDFCDLDDDGDFDLLVGEESSGTLHFFENTGTAAVPVFASPVSSPFGLTAMLSLSSPDLVDIDGDDDFDALVGEASGNIVFFENTGTAMAAAFGASAVNTFGLIDVGSYASPVFVDIDGDGDLDAMIGARDGMPPYGRIVFLRNTGTVLAPAFDGAGAVTNPFGLTDVDFWSQPDFVDIDGDGDLDAFTTEFLGDTIFFENAAPTPTPTATATATTTTTATSTPTPTASPSSATCPAAPSNTCLASTKGQLQLRKNTDDAKDKLKWKFTGGPALAQADFGDPTSTASYALCIYDDGTLKVEAQVGPDGTKWKVVGSKGYLFKDTAGAADGISKMKLLGGSAGKSKLQAKGKGTNLPMPVPVSGTQFFDNTVGVTAQLHEQNGDCYGTSFTSGQAIKNDGKQFKAKF